MSETQSQEAWHAPVLAEGFRGDVLAQQRRLRTRLLDRGAIRYGHARDLAAHMLLHLDDLSGCWSIATNWLRAELSFFRCRLLADIVAKVENRTTPKISRKVIFREL